VSSTRPQLLRKKIILVHRLLQRQEMLGAPVACQSLRDRGVIVFAALIAGGGQSLGGAFAREDRPDDRHAGLARDITDHLGQLEVHLLKGLLHVLHRARGHRHEHAPLPQVAAQHTALVLGTKGAAP
jgi:hypothetical protein